MTSDFILLMAPLLGAAASVLSQIFIGRLLAGRHLLRVIFITFAIGCVVAGLIAAFALASAPLPALEAGALFLCVMIIYAGAGAIHFAIINLGETSLRIRMLGKLKSNPAGLTKNDLIADHDDVSIIALRLQRLKDKHQARFADGIFYTKPSLLFFTAYIIRQLKAILYGSR